MKEFKVITWNFNSDNIDYYDVMPYFREEYSKLFNNIPTSFEDIKNWILKEAQYQFWSRCEYEIIVTGCPQYKNKEKIDVYQQIAQNIDIITELFMSEL